MNPFMSSWNEKRIKELTLGDALDAMSDGFFCICADGKVHTLTNSEDEQHIYLNLRR